MPFTSVKPEYGAAPSAYRAKIERHIAFRDCLRANESERRRYERVKRVLAKRDWNDSNEYAEAKSEVIAEIVATAPPPIGDVPYASLQGDLSADN